MKITLPIADGKTLEFASLKDLAKHYGLMADAYRRCGNEYATGRADAYDVVCWQINQIKIEQ